MMNRTEVLEAARKCVCGQREQDYGTPEDSFSVIAHFWNAYLDAAHPEVNLKGVAECMEVSEIITPKDVAVMMGLLKVARIAKGSNPDSFIDLAGYAACAGEIATRAAETRRITEELKEKLEAQAHISALSDRLMRMEDECE